VLLVLVASGLALLALPGAARASGRGLHPAEWARLCVAALVGGTFVIEVAALLYAAPTLARLSGIHVLAQLCERMLRPLAPGGSLVGRVAVVVAVMLPLLAALGWWRAQREARSARVESWLGRHEPWGDHELVVLPTAQPVAVSVPPLPRASGGQIVVSEGLVDMVHAVELDAVLRHEAAHLRHSHHLYLAAVAIVDHAFAWFPPARRSTATLRIALERWADEEAAAGCGSRDVVRDALLTVTVSLVAGPAIAAFSAAETIIERVEALDGDVPRPRLRTHLLLYCPGFLVGATAVVALAAWATGASSVLAMAGQCS
jgi:hypothetical protein